MNSRRFSMREFHTANYVVFELLDDHGCEAASVHASTYDLRFTPSHKRVEKAFRLLIGLFCPLVAVVSLVFVLGRAFNAAAKALARKLG